LDTGRYEQAVVWRSQALPFMREGLDQLRRALDACPTSLEQSKLTDAIRLTREAIRECERSLTVARKILDKEKKRSR
jgi:hypothetical protein